MKQTQLLHHHPSFPWWGSVLQASGLERQRILKLLAYGACLLVNVLYASFSIVASEPLERIDAVIFTALQFALLLPVALSLLCRFRSLLTRQIWRRGASLGVYLSLALLCLTYSLQSTGITETVVFVCLNGIMATLIAVCVLRQPQSRFTWGACSLALLGALFVWQAHPQHWRANITALSGGSGLTIFAFLVERWLITGQDEEHSLSLWPQLGVLLLTLAGTSLLVALCFGNWSSLRAWHQSDATILAYTSLGTVLLPLLLTIKAQRFLNVVTVSFLAILEPIISALYAYFGGGERLTSLAYVGGAIILVSVVLQTLQSAFTRTPSTAPKKTQEPMVSPQQERSQCSMSTIPALRLLCFPPPGQEASLFRTFPDLLPSNLQNLVEVCPLQLPQWHQDVSLVPDGATLRALAHALVPEDEAQSPLFSELQVPFALLGLGLGGVLSVQVAQLLAQRYACSPQAMCIAACRPPVPSLAPGTLQCPLTVCGGEDAAVSLQELVAWRDYTDGPFRVHLVPGDPLHMPLLARYVVRTLQHVLAQQERPQGLSVQERLLA
ncbi:EamA family transporter [Ktedonospora formicarum]|uniref:EamA domain-containing protein n=1 Tax=Ktedonospora formicarum TaxID=2778364 RepID=A0A8J3MTL2_9CHLR|nr:EamA family transporter [Ktedonospora formicarum]GHO48342.1 hypothetical protein KSX_65050 [Ktedonospora formicarum]